MTDESTSAEGAPSEKKAKKSGLVGLMVLPVVALGSSFGASYVLTPTQTEHAQICPATEGAMPIVETVAKADKTYVELQEILITIGSEPATRYLKMNIAIATDKDKAKTVKEAEPVLIDSFLNYLRAVEISDFEDPSFYARMREQLSRRSELVIGASASDGVLITEFLLR